MIVVLGLVLLAVTTLGRAEAAAAGAALAIGGPGGLTHELLAPGEVLQRVTRGDTVLESMRLRFDERDVIVELVGSPAVRGIASGAAAAVAVAEHRRAVERATAEIVRLENESRRAAGLGPTAASAVVRHQYHRVFLGVAARVRATTVAALERAPGVSRVWPDREVRTTLAESVPLVGASRVWDDLGITGLGTVIAVIDSGIDYTHPDLGGCLGPTCKVIGGLDFVELDADPMDDHGHGTHVAGIAAGNGTIRGVAPDARLLAYKALASNGSGPDSGIIAAIDSAVDPDDDPGTDDGADVINLSLGRPGGPDEPISQAVDNAVAAGVVVVASAGNAGPAYETVGAPGAARRAITVGASDESDQVAGFSARGPAQLTHQIKPDLLAPGVSTTSSVPSGACTLCDPSGYRTLNGTSMAAPHVAGAAALLRQLNPTWSPDQIREALVERCVDLGLDAFTQGSGRLDVFAAATALGLASGGLLSFGLADLTPPIFQETRTVTMTNLDDRRRIYRLSIASGLPPGVTASVGPSSLTLNAGQTKSFTLTLSVDNATVPNLETAPWAYEGRIVARHTADRIELPFAFLKTPVLDIAFDEVPFFLFVHDRADQWWFTQPGLAHRLLLPAGTYDAIVAFQDFTTHVVREDVAVVTRSALTFSRSDAVYPLSLLPVDQNGNRLSLDEGSSITELRHKATDFGVFIAGGGVRTTVAFSPLSDAYFFEMGRLEDQRHLGGPHYTFHLGARDGIAGPVVLENEAADLRPVVLRYAVDPGIERIVPVLFHGGPRALSLGLLPCDPPTLAAPFEEQGYYLPLPYEGFLYGHVYTKVVPYSTQPCAPDLSTALYDTVHLAALDTARVAGFVGTDTTPVFSSTAERLDVGIGPFSWAGQFANSANQIVLRSARDFFLRPYRGQLGDLRQRGPLTYELFRNDGLVSSGILPGGEPADFFFAFSLGVNPDRYTMRVPFDGFFVAGHPGETVTTATFDTRLADPDPPTLLSLQFLSNGEFSDIFRTAATNEIRFRATDASTVEASLTLDLGSGPIAVAIQQSNGEFVAELPTLPATTRGTARLELRDAAGNILAVDTTAATVGPCGDGILDPAEVCDPAGATPAAPRGSLCAPDCTACVSAPVEQTLSGRRLVVRDRKQRRLSVFSIDQRLAAPSPGSAGDPVSNGASLELANPVTGEATLLSLPAAGWNGTGEPPGSEGYEFRGARVSDAACHRVSLKNGRRLKAVCLGAAIGFSLDEPVQGNLAVRLTTGRDANRYCLRFGGRILSDEIGAFRAMDAPPPASCQSAP